MIWDWTAALSLEAQGSGDGVPGSLGGRCDCDWGCDGGGLTRGIVSGEAAMAWDAEEGDSNIAIIDREVGFWDVFVVSYCFFISLLVGGFEGGWYGIWGVNLP